MSGPKLVDRISLFITMWRLVQNTTKFNYFLDLYTKAKSNSPQFLEKLFAGRRIGPATKLVGMHNTDLIGTVVYSQ